MNTYERDKFTNVIYQVSGYWVDNEKVEEKEISEKKVEFCIRGVIKNEDNIGLFMIRVMNWSDNLMILMDSKDQIGELELPSDIPDAVKRITYINGGE